MPEIDARPTSGDLELLQEAAAEAGQLALRYFGEDPEVWMKHGDSPVSEADLAVDRFLREHLMAARPDYGWLSEEDLERSYRSTDVPTFVVDPIDGTRAFIEGKTVWCISIAVVIDGRPVAGVLDCPAKGEVFASARGGGATLNGEYIRVAPEGHILQVAGPKNLIDRVPGPLRSRMQTHPYIPSLAYRVAMVASGRLNATFVRPNAHDWDLAAADLIIEEAGGAILDRAGQRLLYCGHDHRHGEMVVGSGDLLGQLQRSLASGAP